MQEFSYARPGTVAEALALLDEYGDDAKLLAGGTDLLIELRNWWVEPKLVIDVKRIRELDPAIRAEGGRVTIPATTVMSDIVADEHVGRHFPALGEAADVVGSVQIRNRATMAGNICNGSPAADTAPPLLVYGAVVVVAGLDGVRRVPIDDFIIGPGKVDLGRAEMVLAFELEVRDPPIAAAYTRLTRRRGTDLASITLCCGVEAGGAVRLSYGSVGPRALLVVDDTGVLLDPDASGDRKAAALDAMFADASPSPTSLRASPEYRLAMLRVLGSRALHAAIERLEGVPA